jgi:hypothetical protein
MKEFFDHFELTNGRILGISSDHTSPKCLMTREQQTTHEPSGIELPTLGTHIPCMVHVIQLALGPFLSSLGVKDRTKSSEAHEHDQQFGDNESTNIGKSQRL